MMGILSSRKRVEPVILGKELRAIEKKIRKSMTRIGKERDKLRDLILDAQGVADCCERAIEDLERAADALSEYL